MKKKYYQKLINQAIRRDPKFDGLYGCIMKKAYKSEKGASFAAQNTGYRYYHCQNCGDYHLSSAPRDITRNKGNRHPN